MNCLPTAAIEPRVPSEHRQGADLNCRSAQLKRLSQHLDYCRQQRKTATYLEVADAIDIQAPYRIHQLTELLEALMEYDQKHHQPLRAALVVSRARASLPAEGFFLKAQAQGLMTGGITVEFHQQCLSRLFDYPTKTKINAE
jgi:hypothetical protein